MAFFDNPMEARRVSEGDARQGVKRSKNVDKQNRFGADKTRLLKRLNNYRIMT